MAEQTPAVGMHRKLAAIFSTDVAGYSRLMGEDEEATIRTLIAYRTVMTTLIEQHRGRVVDSPGDNLLAEFASVVDAVRCAVEIQKELKVRNAELPDQRRMEFRIGINLGDVVVEGERIYGDGVNIAARVEGLAEAGASVSQGRLMTTSRPSLLWDMSTWARKQLRTSPSRYKYTGCGKSRNRIRQRSSRRSRRLYCPTSLQLPCCPSPT